MGSRERRDFLQIMNRPKRYISRESLDEETVAFDVWEWYYEEQPWERMTLGQANMLTVIGYQILTSLILCFRNTVDF